MFQRCLEAVLPGYTLAFPLAYTGKPLFTELFKFGKDVCQKLVLLFRGQSASSLALDFR